MFLNDLLSLADIDRPVGDNCILLRVSKDACESHPNRDQLSRYAVIWSDTRNQLVTIVPVRRGRAGRAYRRGSK
jgi:hypothetical protein